jgi:hypothetical protein
MPRIKSLRLLLSLTLLAVIMLHWSAPTPARAQASLPRVFNEAPAAFWIFHPDFPRDQFGLFHFRRVVTPEHAGVTPLSYCGRSPQGSPAGH